MSDSLKQTVTSEQAAQQAYRDIMKMMEGHGYCVVTIRAGGRSLEQNALFHMWCSEFAEAMTKKGRETSAEMAKMWFKHKLLGYEDHTYRVAKGEGFSMWSVVNQLKRTSKLTVGEMFHFMERVWEYSAQNFDVFLTIPEDSQYAKTRAKHESGEQTL